jgi:hypothetical protein
MEDVKRYNQTLIDMKKSYWKDVATLALARDQGKGVARLRAYK